MVISKHWVPTVGAVLASLALLPDMWGAEIQKGAIHTVMPAWFYLTCVFAGKVGPVLIGAGTINALRGKAAESDSTK